VIFIPQLKHKFEKGDTKNQQKSRFIEALAKLALKAKFDDFDVGSIVRKLTYPIGHRRFAKNSNPTLKAQIWPQMEFCKSLRSLLLFSNAEFGEDSR
jgi:hypothetical protein